jgi:hypothetical protein
MCGPCVAIGKPHPGCELPVEGEGHYWIFEQIEEVLSALAQKMSEHLDVAIPVEDHVSS